MTADGSRAADGAFHFGDPVAEGRALSSGGAVAFAPTLGVVAVAGPERLSWLHSLCTQAVENLEPGVGVEAMILGPTGRIEHVFGAVDDGESTWLISETADGLAAHLDRMVFTRRVAVALETPRWAALVESGSAFAPGSGPPAWVDPWPGVVEGGTTYGPPAGEPHPGDGWSRRVALVPRDRLDAEIERRRDAGAVRVGAWAAEAARIAAWRPRALTEVDKQSLPHEYDWLRTAVHLDKGCYRGQETVAKVHNVGRPPRRLVFLHLDGSGHVLPDHGAVVSLGDAVVGRVTSVARHHELGPIALALVRRATDPEASLVVEVPGGEPVSAASTPIVDPAGVAATRPPPPGPTAKGLLMGGRCRTDAPM